MKIINWKSIVPHLAAFVIFIVLTGAYFNPLIEGKRLKQSDIYNHLGAAKELYDFRTENHQEALWTNSMFGGMPGYQISTLYPGNLMVYIDKFFKLWLPHPANLIMLCMFGFYFLLQVLRINPWVSIAGSIAFAFSSYFIIYIDAGHNSQINAIAYMAPVLASIILTFRGKYILGSLLTALFLALEIFANHVQITYYLLIVVVIYGLSELISAIREKKYQHFFKAISFLSVAALLAVLINITNLWCSWEYGQQSQRGKSELTSDLHNKTSGLDKDYATDWSFSVGETWTLLIPNFKGGASEAIATKNKEALAGADPQFKEQLAQQSSYFGYMPFTSGPVYVGAIVIFLFILGLFFIKGPMRWVLLAATILSIMLSWGRNFMPLTDFFLDHVPGYNKFRAVSMTIVIAEFCIPLLAFITLDKIFENPDFIKQKVKYFYTALGITAGITLIFWMLPETFNTFITDKEVSSFGQQKIQSPDMASAIDLFLNNLEQVRISIFKADAIRSFLFIIFAGAALIIYFFTKKGKYIFIGIVSLLILADMWSVNKRYLDNNSFVSKSKDIAYFQKSTADEYILKDNSLDYRVLNLAANTYNDSYTSYYHKSIGGYHAAKIKRFQELIEGPLGKEQQALINVLQNKPNDSSIKAAFEKVPVLNMLNTKYYIYNPEAPPLSNTKSLGNAWFVNDLKIVENADAELAAISSNFNAGSTAIIDKRFSSLVSNYMGSKDSSSTIALKEYKPNHLTYESNTQKEQLAVFSEVYYDKGWLAKIDGKDTPYFRTNYVLRGLIVPAGKHKIEFEFHPTSYYTGEKISMASSILLFLLLGGYIVVEFRKKKEEK